MPAADPNWDPNNDAHMTLLQQYQELVVRGLKRAARRNINMGKVSEVIQGPKESPGAFMERLKAAYRQYSTIDPDLRENRSLVNAAFIQQSCKDIRKKIQKIEGFLGMDPVQMLEVARKVFANRDTEDEKAEKQARVMAAAIRGECDGSKRGGRGQGRGGARGRGRGRGKGNQGPGWTPLDKNQCALCKKFGHWKNECYNRSQEGTQGAQIMYQTSDQQ